MSPQNIKISELPSVQQIGANGDELIEVSSPQESGSEQPYLSKKLSLPRLGNWVNSNLEYEQLQTEDKTIIGAINELSEGGGGTEGDWIGAGPHNSRFRGRLLGVRPTEEQYDAIDSGDFCYIPEGSDELEHLFVGDYWYDPQVGIHWRIAAIDTYYNINKGGTIQPLLKHHLIIVPDECIVTDTPMNIPDMGNPGYDPGQFTESSEDGSYAFSFMRGYINEQVEQIMDGQQTSVQLPHEYSYICQVSCYDPVNLRPVEVEWTISGSNKRILPVLLHSDDPNVHDPIPAGCKVTINYKYFDSTLSGHTVWDNYKSGLLQSEAIIDEIFGDEHIMRHPMYLPGEYAKNFATWGGNYSVFTYKYDNLYVPQAKIELMSEAQLFGYSTINNEFRFPIERSSLEHNTFRTPEVGCQEGIFPLFVYNPNLRHNRTSYWLRDHVDNKSEAYVEAGTHYRSKDMYLAIFEDGRLMPLGSYTGVGGYTRTIMGTRPFFCIVKYAYN